MDILVEKEFLECMLDDYLDGNPNTTLITFFKKFPKLKVYSDLPVEDAINNIFLRMLLTHNATLKTKEEFIKKSNDKKLTRRSIAFCGKKKEEWVDLFEKNDGIFFCSNDYKSKLEEILTSHKVIRIKDHPDFDWSDLFPLKNLPGKCALLADNFILSSDYKIKNNAYPIFKSFKKVLSLLTVVTTTNKEDHDEIEDYFEKEKIDTKLQVIPYFKDQKWKHQHDLHARKLIMKYAIIESDKGFDFLPLKKNIQDFKIRVRTIFDKEAYNDLRSYTPLYTGYVKWYKEHHDNDVELPFF